MITIELEGVERFNPLERIKKRLGCGEDAKYYRAKAPVNYRVKGMLLPPAFPVQMGAVTIEPLWRGCVC